MESEPTQATSTVGHSGLRRAARTVLPIVGVVVLAQAVQLTHWRIRFFSGRTYEFCHYAEIARNIVAGRGYWTDMAFPGSLAVYDQLGISGERGWPVLDRFPLYAYWTALFMRVFGPSDLSVGMAAGASYSLLAGLVFWLGRRLSGSRTGCLAAALFLSSMQLLDFTDAGYICFAFAAATTVVCARATRMLMPSPSVGWSSAVALGLLSGIACLARANFVLWMPVFAWVCYRSAPRTRRGIWVLAYAAALLVAISPALAHNLRHFGRPWIVVTGQWNLATATVLPLHRTAWLQYRVFDIAAIAWSHGPELLRKWQALFFEGFLRHCLSFWRMDFVAAFFVVGMFTPMSEKLKRFLFLSLALLGIQVAVFSFLRHEDQGRFYVWFVPAMVLGASHAMLSLPSRTARRIAVALVLTVGFADTCSRLGHFWYRHHYRREPYAWSRDPNYEALQQLLSPDALVLTDEPTEVTWYLKRRTIAMPDTFEDLHAILQRHPVGFTYLANRAPGAKRYRPWHAIIGRAGGPARFAEANGGALLKCFPDGGILIGWRARTPPARPHS